MTAKRVIAIREVSICDYHVDVEFSRRRWFLFGPLITWRQQYRGQYGWKLYPQGERTDAFDPINDWLTAYVEQYEWSKEVPKP